MKIIKKLYDNTNVKKSPLKMGSFESKTEDGLFKAKSTLEV
jgi:hypothetical protein